MFDVLLATTNHSTACGPACLKMLLDFYGVAADLDALIEECGVSVDGCTAGDIMRVSKAHGLELTAWQEEPEDVLRQDRPAIVWWRYNHFVIFAGLNDRDEPVICNPVRGRYAIDRGTFAALCTGREPGTCVALCAGRPEDLHLTAADNYGEGRFFDANRQTYRALRPIARGERLIEGANCEAVSLTDLINELNEEE